MTQQPVSPVPGEPGRPSSAKVCASPQPLGSEAPRSASAQPTLGELVARISENVSGLVRGEIDLAKAKGRTMASKVGVGGVLLTAAGVLALYALGFLLSSASCGLSAVVPVWLAKLIVALVLLVVVAVLALVGKKKVETGLKDAPAPQAGLKRDLQTAKVAIKSGIEKGNDK